MNGDGKANFVIRPCIAILALGVAVSVMAASAWSGPGPVASDWYQGFNNKARLVGGTATRDGEPGLYAGVELAMPEGWKTYWRSPGDAGGVPPEFDWQGSDNLASANVLFAAPHRLHDKAGDVVGYKDGVVFPVLVKPQDPTKPVTLHGKIAYGVCKEICIPAEAELQLVIPPDVGASEDLTNVLARVPTTRPQAGKDPTLANWRLDQNGGKPKLVLNVESAALPTADAFVEAPGGVYVPLPKRAKDASGKAVFEVDLTDGVDLKDLKGKPLTVTMIDGKGQSETTITLE
ncbi:protein-disulfide reductase DsbD domain-containing protein [Hyphomicrobium sp.]|uniref:protein-disulfide reductase DsbD domain-containing protein n=1 Tax=Hyphomicrobium sp. TaxID=82 RepID=UPI002D77EDAB|nr:protein-disulfide reductase DsbD domain-containing protein [Hyphomicrobium sp.]HET6389729.1 protein-disulfide reductase DsbD domain-containing protein [Hyphomicrobium sp.]